MLDSGVPSLGGRSINIMKLSDQNPSRTGNWRFFGDDSN